MKVRYPVEGFFTILPKNQSAITSQFSITLKQQTHYETAQIKVNNENTVTNRGE